jgi:hypothetical protein
MKRHNVLTAKDAKDAKQHVLHPIIFNRQESKNAEADAKTDGAARRPYHGGRLKVFPQAYQVCGFENSKNGDKSAF